MSDLKLKTRNFEGDTSPESYDLIKNYAKTIKGVEGITCEIGLRRAMASVSIMQGLIENNDSRAHVCVDPYGDIIILNDRLYGGSIRTGDYTNKMKAETLVSLYDWGHENNQNIIFFQLEDTEFFSRFNDGVPIYNHEKQIVNKYAFVHVDGPHTLAAAEDASKFFLNKMDKNSIIAYDNCDHYDHEYIEKTYLFPDYTMVENSLSSHKRFYRKN